ncbi:MAG: phosphoglycerate dehydrogenase [Acidimicrobiales bacterium]
MPKVLIAEQISEAGLQRLRDAGHEVDVRLAMSPDQLRETLPGVHALIIRSATAVTAEVLSAGSDLIVVGRAGVGLDNVDVAAATDRGVMVVNAPQSNTVSAAEHTMALLLAQARNIPAAHAALSNGRWERSSWTGVELLGKTLGIVGLGRIGALVAQRAAGFGMRLVAHDPYVSDDRARELMVELLDLDQLVAESDFLTVHVARTPETIGLINAKRLQHAKPSLRVINVARGGIIDESDLAVALASGVIAGAAIDVFDSEPCTDSPLFGFDQVVVTPHLGASTNEAQEKAGITIAEQVSLALAGEFVPNAVNIEASDVSEVGRPFVSLAEMLGRLFASLVETLPAEVEIEFRGEIGGYDNRLAEIAFTKGLVANASDTAVSYVNAPAAAARLGVEVRSSSTTVALDYLNVVTARGGGHALGITLVGLSDEPHLVNLDDHTVDIPPSTHMLVIRNDDLPGLIGLVGTTLGNAAVNISSLHLGRAANGETAMMVASVGEPVSADLLDRLRASDGVHSVCVLTID